VLGRLDSEITLANDQFSRRQCMVSILGFVYQLPVRFARPTRVITKSKAVAANHKFFAAVLAPANQPIVSGDA
jgi:hypothetical protein